MKRQSLVVFSFTLAIALVAAMVFLLGSSLPHSEKAGAVAQNVTTKNSGSSADPLALHSMDAREVAAEANRAKKHPDQTERVVPEDYSSAREQQAWEKEIISLASALGVSDTVKARQLLSMINNLPPEGKVLAMEYATKLIPDEEYLQMRPWVFQLVSSDELRETVMLDALTRSETLRMPTLVEMLRQPENQTQAEVREILVAYLDEDYGNDIGKWDAAVKKFLADNPEL